jgi:hypothetical protein
MLLEIIIQNLFLSYHAKEKSINKIDLQRIIEMAIKSISIKAIKT